MEDGFKVVVVDFNEEGVKVVVFKLLSDGIKVIVIKVDVLNCDDVFNVVR